MNSMIKYLFLCFFMVSATACSSSGGGDSNSKEIWENLALASIGGLIASTILLIMVMPPLYYYCIRAGWGVRRAWRWIKRKVKRDAELDAPVAGAETT